MDREVTASVTKSDWIQIFIEEEDIKDGFKIYTLINQIDIDASYQQQKIMCQDRLTAYYWKQ